MALIMYFYKNISLYKINVLPIASDIDPIIIEPKRTPAINELMVAGLSQDLKMM